MHPFSFFSLSFAPLLLLLLSTSIPATSAIPDEFEGFLHLPQLDATVDEILLDGSTLSLSGEVWSAVCEEIPRCVAFNSAGFLKAYPMNESVDTYISLTNCGVHGPADVTTGSCLKPNSQFVHCHDDQGQMDTFYSVKAVYPLPPHLVADACARDVACPGFMVFNNRERGMLLEHWHSPPVTDVWTRVPQPNPPPPPSSGSSMTMTKKDVDGEVDLVMKIFLDSLARRAEEEEQREAKMDSDFAAGVADGPAGSLRMSNSWRTKDE